MARIRKRIQSKPPPRIRRKLVDIGLNKGDSSPVDYLKPFLGKWLEVKQDRDDPDMWIVQFENGSVESLYKYRFEEPTELDNILFDEGWKSKP